MQRYVTPAPGRWQPPRGNIINREDYKLDINLREYRSGEYVVTIEKFIPEHGWIAQQFFLTEDELDLVKAALNDGKNKP